jgi:hypothetical protein
MKTIMGVAAWGRSGQQGPRGGKINTYFLLFSALNAF